MTPERLNELDEMIEHDEVTVKEGREIAAFLRECAKAEPVAELVNEYSEGHGYLCRHIKLLDMSLPDGTKFYTHPPKQEQSPIDERAEFEKWYKSHLVTGLDLESFREGAAYKYTEGDRLNIAYEAWQAARKLSAPVLADETKKLYEELIYSVASKFPDETRHQTALRYIRNAEKGTSEKADQTRLQFSMLESSPVSYSANASDAPQVSPVVPDEMLTYPYMHEYDRAIAKGWNDCRAAMLKGEK